MKTRGLTKNDLQHMGVPPGEARKLAGLAVEAALDAGESIETIRATVKAIVRHPEAHRDDARFGALAAQTDLVDPLARFDPRLVKMAPAGEPAED